MAEQPAAAGILRELRRNWEGFGESDPLWAVLTDPHRAGGRWEADCFLATGEEEIQIVMQRLASQGIVVSTAGRALDFGCGAGRLTYALGARFSEAHGVDIADSMIQAARRLNPHAGGCCFHQHDSTELALFEPRSFAFVYSSIVLQHIPPPVAEQYVTSLLRLLEPGGVAVLQAPDRFNAGPVLARLRQAARDRRHWVRSHVALRTRLARLRSAGASREDMNAGPHMEMHAIPEVKMRAIARAAGVHLADVALTNSTELDFNGRLEYLEHPPIRGWVSKQYILISAG